MKIKGELNYKVIQDGKIVQDHTLKNLIVNGGKDALARLVGNDNMLKYVDKIGIGEGSGTPAAGDTSLTNQFLKVISGVTFPAVNKVAFSWTISTAEGNGMSIEEFGLFTNDNTMFARRLALSTITKNNTISLQGTWTLTF